MFGYIKPYKPELKIKDYETYKSIYCGLCKELGKSFGIKSRLLLNYDCTFLLLLVLSLRDSDICFSAEHCTCNPLKKCNFCASEKDEFKLSAALCVLMSYYKLIDNDADSGFLGKFLWKALKLFFKSAYKKAKNCYPQFDNIIKAGMDKQSQIEKQRVNNIDECAEPTAWMLSQVFKLLARTSSEEIVLDRFGYFLGRWVYLIDAIDDLEKDKKEKNFNPFINPETENSKQGNIYFNSILNQTIAQLISAYNLLDINRFKDIIDNIIICGLAQIQKNIIFKEKEVNNHV